ncbi:hypothetical protein [Enterococcus hailinensis]|uniref:hypothetical protein n=1 Tax=Enterococcus hailinensis TaxID=3238988 RepID=UPI0038B2E99E
MNYNVNRSSEIFGIIFARPTSLNKKFIQDNYYYWNVFSGNNFDVFWPGYGAYYNAEDVQKMSLIALKVDGLKTDLQFHTESFIQTEREIKDYNPKFKFDDTYPLLVLLEYKNGNVDYGSSLFIQLVDNKEQIETSIYKTMKEIIELFSGQNSLNNFERAKLYVKNKYNSKNLLTMALSAVELFTLF